MKIWIAILFVCVEAGAQNINITNVPVARGFGSTDLVLGLTNNHIALVPWSTLTTNILYGSYGTNVLAQPQPFTVQASDWNPIVISGAGTAAANGSYDLLVSNLTASIPFAIWSNRLANGYFLVLNDTNLVPSSVFSNLWTIQNTIGVNYKYDLISATPFGTWEVSGLGGVAGSSPAPAIAQAVMPSLLAASANATGGFLTLSPGVYNIGGYEWFPTNLTIQAGGAVIVNDNGVKCAIPYGRTVMYGGVITNGSIWGAGSGALCVDFSNVTNRSVFYGTKFFGPTDVINGQLVNDNTELAFVGCEMGTWWDIVTISKGASLSNTVISLTGCYLWSRTNQGLSASSTMVTANLNQGRFTGNFMEQGLGFTLGNGITQNSTTATNELSGNVLWLQPGVKKLNNFNGVMIVQGYPYNLTDEAGTITHTYPFLTAQNIWTGSNYFSTVANAANFTAGTITNRASAGSRVELTDANGKLIDAAASGTVPIDADGSATTFAQVNALTSTNPFLTNNETLAVMLGSTFTSPNSNYFGMSVPAAMSSPTNSGASVSFDFTKLVALLTTNNAFVTLGVSGKDSAGKDMQWSMLAVTNSAGLGSAFVTNITFAANTHVVGPTTLNLTNWTEILCEYWPPNGPTNVFVKPCW